MGVQSPRSNATQFQPGTLPPTEGRLEASTALDELDTIDILRLLNREDAVAAVAVAQILPQLASLVDLSAARIRAGGSIHYLAAGTSGRLACSTRQNYCPPSTSMTASSPPLSLVDRRRC